MMTSSNGNIFRVTGLLCGDRWISLTKPSDAQLWCFLWSAPQQTVEQTMETSVIRDAIALIKMKNVCMIREMYCDLVKLTIQSVSMNAFLTSRQIPHDVQAVLPCHLAHQKSSQQSRLIGIIEILLKSSEYHVPIRQASSRFSILNQRQNGRHSADDIYQTHFLEWKGTSLFPTAQLIIFHHWLSGLRQANIWTDGG